MCSFGEQRIVYEPVRGVNKPGAQVDGVLILDNAAHLNFGQGKCLRKNSPITSPFDQKFLEHLTVKLGNRSVRPDIFIPFFVERNLNVAILPSLFFEYLDAEVIVFVRDAIVVSSDLAV